MTIETEYVPIEKRVRTLEVFGSDEMHTASVRVSNEHDDWHTIHVTDDAGSAKDSKASMLLGLKAACEAVRERCVEAALSAGTAGGYPGENAKRYHAQDIAFIIRGLEL